MERGDFFEPTLSDYTRTVKRSHLRCICFNYTRLWMSQCTKPRGNSLESTAEKVAVDTPRGEERKW